MLKQRLITASFLIPGFVFVVFYLPTELFLWVMTAVVTLAAWEWSRLVALGSPVKKYSFIVIVPLLVFVASSLNQFPFLLGGASLFWFTVLIWMIVWVPANPLATKNKARPNIAAASIFGFLVLVPPAIALSLIHGHPDMGPVYVIFLLVMIWIADAGAYFVGKSMGKRKLAPLISPGKTWEGFLGGLVLSIIYVLLVDINFNLSRDHTLIFCVLSGITVTVSVVGDLFESFFKRRANMKDSSQLLPGHGGVLDRIDSIVAAAPVFLFGFSLVVGDLL